VTRAAEPVRKATGAVALQVPFRLDQVAIVNRIPLLRRLRIADRRLVNAAHRRGLAVHVWTLNDTETIRVALGFGADGILTDYPSVLTTILEDTDNYWTP
jgi:glycerophosphoryl diester phosphodiesterase